jgi:hypothetical protein
VRSSKVTARSYACKWVSKKKVMPSGVVGRGGNHPRPSSAVIQESKKLSSLCETLCFYFFFLSLLTSLPSLLSCFRELHDHEDHCAAGT